MKIALDAMGGDHAPTEIVAGALRAVSEGFVTADQIVLVGHEEKIRAELAEQAGGDIEIVHAPEAIEMDEHPAMALRAKRKSSIVVGSKLVRSNDVGAFVSAGNTGAMVGAGTLVVKTLPGVRRPGIAATFSADGGAVTLIDVGANIHCQPEDLYAYAEMACAYRTGVDGIERPRVGLLSIGEEDAKGGPLVTRTRELLKASSLNFVGNVEGQDVFSGRCDVIVAEGFVGNVVLKVSEGLGQFIASLLEREIRAHADEADAEAWSRIGRSLLSRTDYAEYGGAPLLGVNGLFIICHGRSDRRAIANALRVSRQYLEANVNTRIVEELARHPDLDASAAPGAPGSEDSA